MGFTKDRLKEDFIAYFGKSEYPLEAYFAPGRVNLLGEHTDYNGGFVLPFSIQYGTLLLIRKSENPLWRFRSENMQFIAEVSVTNAPETIGNTWVNYPLGVLSEFIKSGIEVPGLDFLYSGNIPNGAGLSSSASIEMVTALALNEMFNAGLQSIDLVKMSQSAENNFVGMNCGIMDQFVVGMGKKDKAIFLNCDTLGFELIPADMGDYGIMIANSNVRRELAGSAYNKRRSECEMAVEIISKKKNIRHLSVVTFEEWENLQNEIQDPVIRKRARHVITENRRVMDGIEALKKNDHVKFGELMLQSHKSLRYDYEVSCRELDILVDCAMECDGVIGARMTGAGFGGCTISLVHKDAVETFKKEVSKKYSVATGLVPGFYPAQLSDGAKKMNLT